MRQPEETRLNYGDHALIITPTGVSFIVEVWLNVVHGNTSLNPAFRRVMLSEYQTYESAVAAGESYLNQPVEENS